MASQILLVSKYLRSVGTGIGDTHKPSRVYSMIFLLTDFRRSTRSRFRLSMVALGIVIAST